MYEMMIVCITSCIQIYNYINCTTVVNAVICIVLDLKGQINSQCLEYECMLQLSIYLCNYNI